MRRLVPLLIAVLVVGLFGSTMWFLWSKSRPRPVSVVTAKPTVTDIVRKTVAAGTVQPRKEIEIKPKVSGILKTLHVEAGTRVQRGDLIAEIEIIPDVVSLNDAELRLRSARLNLDKVRRELDRAEALGARGMAANTEVDRLRADHHIAGEEVSGAEMRVKLLREGAATRGKGASTRVESTVAGTVLAVLAREGASVINANSFNPGTTIVSVADMSDLVFKGRVDEAEVGKLAPGMPVEIVVGALGEMRFEGKLERIAPKSLAKEGTTEFEVEAALRPPAGVQVRAGYSANANIVLERRTRVLAIEEAYVQFEKDSRFVEVEVGPARFERRPVKLGTSDGIRVEILGGLREVDVIRKPSAPGGPPAARGG